MTDTDVVVQLLTDILAKLRADSEVRYVAEQDQEERAPPLTEWVIWGK